MCDGEAKSMREKERECQLVASSINHLICGVAIQLPRPQFGSPVEASLELC